ncbi:MAG TPA: PAS domain-containing protein [Terracidiphilus sp.]|jgi:PAS domain S-box-containing protein|nr:PAS domain-containing protein [Terracidiphilus sp.]
MISHGSTKTAPLERRPVRQGADRIVGSGEMADLVRSHDWSATQLGPIASWSRELLAIVNLTLCSPVPARTLWGPDLILIYNDGYRDIPGKRHPDALGKPAREVYRDSWHQVGPLLEEAFASGSTLSNERLRVPIETHEGLRDFYLNYSFTPVFQDGRVAGLFGLLQDVTDEVTATRSLRENEARAWRVLQSIADAVIVTDADARIVQMNRVAETLTGWTLPEAANRPLEQIFLVVDETTRKPLENPAEKVRRLATTTAPARRLVLLRRDGTETSIDHSGSPIFDNRGGLVGTVLVFRDVGEQRAAEEERTELARQLSLVLDATTDGVLCVDRNWRMIYRNRRAQEMLQATGELTGRLFWETFPEAVFEGSPYIEHYYRAMERGVPGKFEAWYPEPFNKWFKVDAHPSEHGIVIFFRDITEQKREAEALRESEAKLRAIYSTSLEYTGLLTPDGVVLDCNRASLEFAHNRREDVVGRHFAETPWFTGTPGAPDLVRQAIAAAGTGETFRREIELHRPDGETMAFDFSLTPLRDETGKIAFLVPEGRDITEVKRAESALLKSEKLAAVGRLASSIAHEINNPLESVMNLIFLARHANSEDARNYLELADQEIRRVSIIANQTLRFHKQASSPQAATGADLFTTVMSIYEGRLRNAHVQVEKKFRTEEPVICFQGDVRQVLNNLVSNALEAMPFGGRLLIRSRKGRNWKTGEPGLVLTIADSGTGMPPEVQRHIFEAFYTTKGTAGNGLGLWVCQEIVERHHGVLRVRSCQREGRSGTTFALFLPFQARCE